MHPTPNPHPGTLVRAIAGKGADLFYMKKDTFYFSHDYNANSDTKILFLRQQLGMEGYGIYWYLIEALAQAGGYLPYKIAPVLAMQMQVTEAKVIAVIDKFDLFTQQEQSFFSERLNLHLSLRATLSEKGRVGASKRWEKQAIDSPPNSPPIGEGNAKERKGKESKEKESKEKGSFAKILFADMKTHFLSEYKIKTGTEYYWGAKDAVHLNEITKKIIFKIKEKEKSTGAKEKENYDADVLVGFKHLLSASKDKWIQSNFSIPIFNSKFNEIFTQILSTNGNAKASQFLNAVDERFNSKHGS